MDKQALEQLVDAAIAARPDSMKPTAVKRGNNPHWPYVPIVDHGDRTEQIRRQAYQSRAEAVAFADTVIKHRRQVLRETLLNPRYRALRESYGLPREIG